MVDEQLRARGIRHEAVLRAMEKVPRHLFVPEEDLPAAYEDHPLPIGHGQTISQPYIVAYMTEALDPKPHHRILEIGTGSGYQTAVLAEIVADVFSVEIVAPLSARAAKALSDGGYRNVHLRVADGYDGWVEEAPFDGIIVTAAPPRVPEPLIDQLAMNARLVIPVGDYYQELLIVTREESGTTRRATLGVAFVPMTGKVRA